MSFGVHLLNMTCEMVNYVTSCKYFLFGRECFIAEKPGCFFPRSMICFISLSLKSRMEGQVMGDPQLPFEFDELFLLYQVTANREARSRTEVSGVFILCFVMRLLLRLLLL